MDNEAGLWAIGPGIDPVPAEELYGAGVQGRERMLADYGPEADKWGRYTLKSLTIALLGRIGIDTVGGDSRIYKSLYRQLQRFIAAANDGGAPMAPDGVEFPCDAATALAVMGDERVCRHMLSLRNKYAGVIVADAEKGRPVPAGAADVWRSVERGDASAVAALLADAGDPERFLARSQAAFLFSVWLSERGLAFDRDAYELDMAEMRALAAACRSESPDPELVARALELHDRLSNLGDYVSR